MTKIPIKALGQTIEHKGEIILVVEDMPVNCMVLFVEMEIWKEIKEEIEQTKWIDTR